MRWLTDRGFEAHSEKLGAQRQIAGGGRYAEGVGWAIGLDRLLLALEGV
jgi:histidyl-tRNA synthetase